MSLNLFCFLSLAILEILQESRCPCPFKISIFVGLFWSLRFKAFSNCSSLFDLWPLQRISIASIYLSFGHFSRIDLFSWGCGASWTPYCNFCGVYVLLFAMGSYFILLKIVLLYMICVFLIPSILCCNSCFNSLESGTTNLSHQVGASSNTT